MIVVILVVVAAGLVIASQMSESRPLAVLAAFSAAAVLALVLMQTVLERRRGRALAGSVFGVDAVTASIDDAPVIGQDEDAANLEEEPEVNLRDSTVVAPVSSAPSPTADDAGEEEIVYVVSRRRRFHAEECRSILGRDREKLTRQEAIEEGFTPCSLCHPR